MKVGKSEVNEMVAGHVALHCGGGPEGQNRRGVGIDRPRPDGAVRPGSGAHGFARLRRVGKRREGRPDGVPAEGVNKKSPPDGFRAGLAWGVGAIRAAGQQG